MRELRGLSLSDVENLTGIKASNISKYERGHRLPSAPTIYRFAEALGFDPIARALEPWLDAFEERKRRDAAPST